MSICSMKSKEISDFFQRLSIVLRFRKFDNITSNDILIVIPKDVNVFTNNSLRQITCEELEQIAYQGNTIAVGSSLDFDNDMFPIPKIYNAPNNQDYFTVKELIRVIENFEKYSRPQSNWVNGVDTNHKFFEGFVKMRGGLFIAIWGS